MAKLIFGVLVILSLVFAVCIIRIETDPCPGEAYTPGHAQPCTPWQQYRQEQAK